MTTSSTTPMIFIFSNVRGGGDGPALALAEDGTCLGSHWCSHESFVPFDLGDTHRADRRATYQEHYPDGYVIEFIPSHEVASHPGLIAAYAANQAMAGSRPGRRLSTSSTSGPAPG